MSNLNDSCYIDGKEYLLSEVEQMGWDDFCYSAHIHPYKSLFKYYPNTTKYVKEEKKHRNFSFEALKDNTVFLQDAKNFDDCFDCAVDLDWDKFLFTRVTKYCDCFSVKTKSDNINDIVYALSTKLYELGTIEKCVETSSDLPDEVQRLHVEMFIQNVFIKFYSGEQWMSAVFSAIQDEYKDFAKALSKFKISCFSTSPYLNRMWSSAYADNNRGFCIEYEVDLSTQTGMDLYTNILPVIYSQTRNDFVPLSKNFDSTITKDDLWQMYFNGFLRKSVHWKDQLEWRLILPDGFISQNPIPFFKIKRVYLGNKMSIKERRKIIKYCHSNKIEYVGLIRENNSFNLVECKDDGFVCPKTTISDC